MSRYGTLKYSEQKYGASENANLLWALQIDWEGNGNWAHNEAARLHRLQTMRGNDYYLSGNGFEQSAIGAAIMTLDNYDGRFDPWNTSGPLYGYLKPGLRVKLWVRNGIGGTDHPIIAGILQDIKPYGRRGEVDLVLEDGWRWLSDRTVSVALQSNIYADDAIGLIADAVNYPWGYELDTGPDQIKYWWSTGKKAKSEIEDITNSGIGEVFVANDGKLKYYSRQLATDPVLVLNEDGLLKDITIPQPWEFQRNIIKINCKPRVIQSSQDIWRFYDTPAIAAGKTIYIWAEYVFENQNVPATDVITPAATTDYTANAAANGSGTDKTANITVSLPSSNIFAETAKIAVTNNDASVVYLTMLKLRGKPIAAPNVSPIIFETGDYLTVPRLLNLDFPWQQDYNVGVNISEYLGDFLSTPQAFPTVIIEGRPEIQFAVDLNDHVSLHLKTWGVDANFKVGKIKHKFLAATGQHVQTELKLFPVYVPPVDSYWYLGTAGLSELGVTTYLGV